MGQRHPPLYGSGQDRRCVVEWADQRGGVLDARPPRRAARLVTAHRGGLMPRDVAGVTHLGGERWRVRIYAGKDPLTGKERQLSRTYHAATRTAAMKQAEAYRVEMRKQLKTAAANRGTIRELGDRFLALKRRDRAPSTVTNYARIVDRIVDTFGHLPIEALTGRMIDDWYGRLMDGGMTAATVQHHHSVLRAMLRQAVKSEMAERVATIGATPPSAPKYETRPPTIEVARLLLDEARGDLAAALHVLAATGIRRGELVGLHWSDIEHGRMTVRRSITELKGGVLHVGPPKGKKARTIKITAQTWLTLMRHRERVRVRAEKLGVTLPADGPIFVSFRGSLDGTRPYKPSWVSHGWDRIRKTHGVTFRPHDLRHANATWMTDAGIPVTTGAKRLGHAQTSTFTDVYGHGTDEADARAVAVLELMLPAPEQ